MKDFYADFKNIHNQVKEACDCILKNSCIKLKDEIENIKTAIDKITTLNWQDSASIIWQDNKKNCSNKLELIINSINSVFVEAEKTYHLLNEQLDNLLKVNTSYQETYQQKPNIIDYRTPIYITNDDGTKTFNGYDYSLYNKVLNDWQLKISNLENQCDACKNNANSYLNILAYINQTSISLAATTNFSISYSIPKLIIPSILTYKLSELLTTCNFNNNTYKIIDTSKSYQDIAKKNGKQKPDKCLDYSSYYASDILKQSGGRKTASTNGKTTNALTSENENEILQIAATEVLEGRPCIIQVNGKHKSGDAYTRHFVTVAGIKDNYDYNNLKQSDFLIIDPATATLKPLDTKLGDYTTRFLLSGKNTSRNYDYLVLVYNDPDRYETNSCKHITKY